MTHKLTIEGAGADTQGRCSCGRWAELGTYAPKNRRAHIRTEHGRHVEAVQKAEALEKPPVMWLGAGDVLTVNVTAEHIAQGQRHGGPRVRVDLCPVGLALKERTGLFWDLWFTEAVPHHRELRAPLSAEMTERLKHYDATGEMEPFTLTLTLQEKAAKVAA